jgi:hypothetical protein
MFFIHDTSCISPQETFFSDKIFHAELNELNQPEGNKFNAAEPAYESIPAGMLRRMGRSVRLGIGAAMPLLQKSGIAPDGFIIGTSMGGMEDCVKFLNQIIEYNEGKLTPTNFVQSTPNAVAGQLGLLTKNKGYNITHVHRGLSFENAVIDAGMSLAENPANSYLLGAVEEISGYHYNIERLDGWYKEENCSIDEVYNCGTPGSIAGEGSSMFIVNNEPVHAKAKLRAIHIFHSDDEQLVASQLKNFLEKNLPAGEKPGLFLSGENGDMRHGHFYNSCEKIMGTSVSVARFKHLSGEHPTASAFAFWLACEIIKKKFLPQQISKHDAGSGLDSILIYNHYKGIQHSFMLLEKA